jgi:hypothetical protein
VYPLGSFTFEGKDTALPRNVGILLPIHSGSSLSKVIFVVIFAYRKCEVFHKFELTVLPA